MPLSKLQADILRTLAAHRGPESYVADSTPLHRSGPRYSGDIDIFHHREEQIATTAENNVGILINAAFIAECYRPLEDRTQVEPVVIFGEKMMLRVADLLLVTGMEYGPQGQMTVSNKGASLPKQFTLWCGV